MTENRCLVTANYLAATLNHCFHGLNIVVQPLFLCVLVHVMSWSVPRRGSVPPSYEFLETLQQLGQNFVLAPQKRVIQPGVWLTGGSRILYFSFLVLRLLRKATTNLFASLRPYSRPRGIARLSPNDFRDILYKRKNAK